TVAMHCCSFLSSYPALPYTYTLSLHDALPIFLLELLHEQAVGPGEDLPIEVTQLVTGLIGAVLRELDGKATKRRPVDPAEKALRSEEHTSELQSRVDLVCRLLLEKQKQ